MSRSQTLITAFLLSGLFLFHAGISYAQPYASTNYRTSSSNTTLTSQIPW
jgi:hypothetical protein